MEFKLIHSSLPRTLIRSNIKTISIHRHFHLHAQFQRWRCQIQGMSSNGQHSSKKIMVHVVKEGESLISISKLYGLTICEIAAANKNIIDVDLVFEGQLLSIPSVIPLPLQMRKGEPANSSESSHSGRTPSLGLYSSFLNQKIFNVPSFHHLSYAKTTGYFLVLVPLIAFCIRCIMGALHNRVNGDLKHNVIESEDHRPGSKRTRWKSALQELRDPDAIDTELAPDHDHLTEDQDEGNYEDLSDNYTKLESDYEKFLSECGISKWGYWRGGSPK